MEINKRNFLKFGVLSAGTAIFPTLAHSNVAPAQSKTATAPSVDLNLSPITDQERQARIAKAKTLMQEQNVSALVLEPGAALTYFTGIRWWRSERFTGVVIPQRGKVVAICPFFEAPSIREMTGLISDVRVWQEHQDPFVLVQQVVDETTEKPGSIAFENSVRYFILKGIMDRLSNFNHVSGEPITRGCRMYKSNHEIQLMHKANEITLAAYRHVFANLELGMSQAEVKALMNATQVKLGGSGAWCLALFNEASAYPHGTKQTQVIKPGSTILLDSGCSFHGYQSDISRTLFFGQPSKQQVQIWNTVRQGQTVAMQQAKLMEPAGSVDDAVRAFYQQRGLGPDYQLPGLSHRTGHGIGMEGHESVNFVRGETALLKPGMCFSNEPGIYLPGKFGVRLEDCLYMTEAGAQWFTHPPEHHEAPLGQLTRLALSQVK